MWDRFTSGKFFDLGEDPNNIRPGCSRGHGPERHGLNGWGHGPEPFRNGPFEDPRSWNGRFGHRPDFYGYNHCPFAHNYGHFGPEPHGTPPHFGWHGSHRHFEGFRPPFPWHKFGQGGPGFFGKHNFWRDQDERDKKCTGCCQNNREQNKEKNNGEQTFVFRGIVIEKDQRPNSV